MQKPGKMLIELLKHVGKAPATTKYPFEKIEMPEKFRGQIRFIAENCIGCKICMRDCPSEAITITKIGEKMFEATFDLDKCLYCAQCVLSCPKDALDTTTEFELAQIDKSKLKVKFRGKKPAPKEEKPAEGSAEPTAKTPE